jgi:cellulose synthase (UDP-forming)
MLRALLLRPARALGVENPGDPWLWLKRLFLLPPGTARPWPGWLLRIVLPLIALMARELQVRDAHRAGDWLHALFLVAPLAPDAPRRPSILLEVGRSLAGLPLRLLRLLLLPLRPLQRRFDRIDFGAAGRRVDAAANAFALGSPLMTRLAVIAATVLLLVTATTPLGLHQQFMMFGIMWVTTLLIRRLPGNGATLLMLAFSLIASSRYIWWRLTQTLELDPGPDLILGLGLIAAETYTWLILVLGYVQNAWPLKRPTVPLPADTSLWPTVDVYIPSYNEPLKVVKPTVLAAMSMDWPRDKLRIHLLDDGRRDEFKRFAAQAGIHYIVRPDNAHAKAGNLNHAMKITNGDFIAIFDCDHIPVRSFLQTTMGWFLKDPKCAMLQTPHHFFSPDPFERNLGTFRRVPNEGSLFYGLVQDGNDLWNAAFFCGSCAILRRGPLMEVGGIAVETVTEDAHTALKLHRRGYNTAYIKLTQAAGLATESLSSHIGQRIRWARGMAQIFRTDNPLFGRGLSLFQRLCYANAMLHFFYGLPRLVFLTAPLSYLYFELHVINAAATTLAAYVLPHLFQASLANSRIQGQYRHSFWAEAYESVLAWYIALPTTVAMFNPKAGSFNVTAKGGLVERDYFDWNISLPYVALVVLNLGGVALAIPRLLSWNAHEPATVLMNLAWAVYNLVMLGAALGVAAESRQVRVAHRVPMRVPATLYLPDGRVARTETEDYSTQGLGVVIGSDLGLSPGAHVKVGLNRGDQECSFPARVVVARGGRLGLHFDTMSLEDERNLIQCTFGRADAWIDWTEEQQSDRPLTSLGEVLSFGAKGYLRLAQDLYTRFESRWLRRGRREAGLAN